MSPVNAMVLILRVSLVLVHSDLQLVVRTYTVEAAIRGNVTRFYLQNCDLACDCGLLICNLSLASPFSHSERQKLNRTSRERAQDTQI